MRKSLLVLIALIWLLGARAIAQAGTITVDVRDATITEVLMLLGAESETNIVADSSIRAEKITFRLAHVSLEQALAVLVESQGLAIHHIGSVIVVGTAESMNRRYAGASAENGPETGVFTLLHSDVSAVAKEMEGALPPGTTIVSDKRTGRLIVSGDHATVSRARTLVPVFDANESSFTSDKNIQVYHLRYSRPSDITSSLKGALPDTLLIADDAQNAILVGGGDDVQSVAGRFIERMDVPSLQVLFEVRVADVRPVNEQSDIGIQLGGYDLSGQAVAGATTYAFAKNSLAINARLNALISSGHARILATPKLLTLNNHEADLLIGETYPVTYYDSRLGGQQVQFVDIGVKLRLTPTIGSDGSVTAEMHPEYSAIEGFVGGYPVLTSRKVDSKLRVKDGETIVLGGLLRDIDSEAITRIPGLSSIPVIGKLFEDRQRTHQRDEVIFLITPHILRTTGVAANVK